MDECNPRNRTPPFKSTPPMRSAPGPRRMDTVRMGIGTRLPLGEVYGTYGSRVCSARRDRLSPWLSAGSVGQGCSTRHRLCEGVRVYSKMTRLNNYQPNVTAGCVGVCVCVFRSNQVDQLQTKPPVPQHLLRH